jgi:hypothetical protein
MVSPNVSVAVFPPTVAVAVADVEPTAMVLKLNGLDESPLSKSVYVQVTVDVGPDVTTAPHVPSAALVNVKYALS